MPRYPISFDDGAMDHIASLTGPLAAATTRPCCPRVDDPGERAVLGLVDLVQHLAALVQRGGRDAPSRSMTRRTAVCAVTPVWS